MTPERWQQITEVFYGALARDARDRAAFVEEACAGDETVRREVEAMLAQPMTTAGLVDPIAFSADAPHDRMSILT